MQKYFIVIMVYCLLLAGCKWNSREKDNADQVYRYTQYGMTVCDIKVDTALFRAEMDYLLPADKILSQFGSGYHNFYMGVRNVYNYRTEFLLCTEAPFFDSKGGSREFFPYMSYESSAGLRKSPKLKESADQVSNNHGNSRADGRYIFYTYYPDERNIFKITWNAPDSAKLMKNNMSLHLFEINLAVDKNGKIIKPWTLKEVKSNKFSPHYTEKEVNRYSYSTGLPAVSMDGFETIRKSIKYPDEAQRNGVTGRVVVEIFADAEGKYAGYHLIKGLGYGCDEAVIEAIKDAKFQTYPTGQRSSIIVPFEFGPVKTTPIDLAVGYFNYNSDPDVYNNINLAIVNKNKLARSIEKDYFIYVYVNKHLIFQTICRSILESDIQQQYWIRFDGKKPGTYEYAVYIDPENRLNESGRENNTLRGTLIAK